MTQTNKEYILPEEFLLEPSFCNYCKGTPEADVHYWKQWLKMHPQQTDVFREAERIYKVIGAYDEGFEAAFARFKQELYALPEQTVKPRPDARLFNMRKVAAAAAVILVAGSSVLFIMKRSLPAHQAAIAVTQYDTVTTASGKVRRVVLTDGSTVTLNSQSRLLIPTNFNSSIRKVLLEGEAFFEVMRNPQKPFLIVSNEVETKVLGTSFNIQARPQQSTVKVTVVTGLVAVTPATKPTVQLKPNEQVVVGRDRAAVVSQVVAADYKLWTNGELFFKNESLEDIAVTLSAHFNKQIVFEDDNCRTELYTASFERGKSIEKVLELLSFGRNISFSQKENTIIIHRAHM